MRKRKVVLGAAVLAVVGLGTEPGAEALPKGNFEPIRVTQRNERTVRFNALRPSHVPQFQKVARCTTEHRNVEVPSSSDVPVWEAQVWRRCVGYDAGNGAGQWFQVASFAPAGEDEAEVEAPTPTFQIEGNVYTQRPSYFWVPAEYGAGIVVPVEFVGSHEPAGIARIIATKVTFDPGTGNGAIDCPIEQAVIPYNPSNPHATQNACTFTYYISSRPGRAETVGGTYKARIRIHWKVLTAQVFGTNVNPNSLAGVSNLTTSSNITPITVREIQTLVTCKQPNNSCAA